jgi:hypothetical protein
MLNELAKMLPENTTTFREAITAIEDILLPLPQTELPLTHHFSDGLYARECFLPANTVVTGKIHKHEHLCVLFGDVSVADGTGEPTRYRGYHVVNSLPGTKRILTDLDELESALVCGTYTEFDQYVSGLPASSDEPAHLEVMP